MEPSAAAVLQEPPDIPEGLRAEALRRFLESGNPQAILADDAGIEYRSLYDLRDSDHGRLRAVLDAETFVTIGQPWSSSETKELIQMWREKGVEDETH